VLGVAYHWGDGVPRDFAQARHWYQEGAERGNSFCMMFLGDGLMRGEFGEASEVAGLEWLTRAAQADNWWAIAELGQLYERGALGVKRDLSRAAQWKRLLAKRGDEEARGWLTYHGFAAD